MPHRLVDSFKATLEEALVADLILHLVDLSNPEYEAQMETTAKVLAELGAADKELLTVYNKIDQLENGLEKLKAKESFINPFSLVHKQATGSQTYLLNWKRYSRENLGIIISDTLTAMIW